MLMLRTKVGGKKFNKVVIRFRRRGHVHYPIYEIVVIKQNARIRGLFIEKLGYFNPNFTERTFVFDATRLAYWVIPVLLFIIQLKNIWQNF